jgi:hypothetical protein
MKVPLLLWRGGFFYAIIEIKVLRCDFLRKNRKGIIVKVYKKTS